MSTQDLILCTDLLCIITFLSQELAEEDGFDHGSGDQWPAVGPQLQNYILMMVTR